MKVAKLSKSISTDITAKIHRLYDGVVCHITLTDSNKGVFFGIQLIAPGYFCHLVYTIRSAR